ncbi:MAG: hypothetical protein ACREMB_07900 [Candidatus Rokuibacteriota bacterium]
MATITYTEADVARLLHLPDAAAVEGLVESEVLRVAGFTVSGRPIFTADDVSRAAAEIAFAEQLERRRRGKGRAVR